MKDEMYIPSKIVIQNTIKAFILLKETPVSYIYQPCLEGQVDKKYLTESTMLHQ